MAGLVPAIHVFAANERETWMPGKPGHDAEVCYPLYFLPNSRLYDA
jgi:hypothetical protein